MRSPPSAPRRLWRESPTVAAAARYHILCGAGQLQNGDSGTRAVLTVDKASIIHLDDVHVGLGRAYGLTFQVRSALGYLAPGRLLDEVGHRTRAHRITDVPDAQAAGKPAHEGQTSVIRSVDLPVRVMGAETRGSMPEIAREVRYAQRGNGPRRVDVRDILEPGVMRRLAETSGRSQRLRCHDVDVPGLRLAVQEVLLLFGKRHTEYRRRVVAALERIHRDVADLRVKQVSLRRTGRTMRRRAVVDRGITTVQQLAAVGDLHDAAVTHTVWMEYQVVIGAGGVGLVHVRRRIRDSLVAIRRIRRVHAVLRRRRGGTRLSSHETELTDEHGLRRIAHVVDEVVPLLALP